MRLKHFLSVFLTLLTLSVGNVWGADVNDPDNVVSGSQYLIKAVKSTTNYYLVAPTSSGKGSSTTTKANATVFTMTKESNKWYVTFTKNDVTYYLSGSTTNGNVTINTNKTECTVFEKSGNYIKIGTTKWIQLNSSSTTIMGCYSSSQTGVVLEPVASSFTVEWSITSGGGTLSATSGTSTTVIPTSGWRYADPAYTVLTGASVVLQSTNTFTATPTQNSTIQINMEEIPSHKIHFNTGGLVEIASVDVLEGETYNITETPATSITNSCEYNTFVGWTTSSSIADASVKPTTITSYEMEEDDVTLYAVYSKTVGGGSSDVIINFGYSNWGETAQFSGDAKNEVSQEVDGISVTDTKNTGSLYANSTSTRFYKANELTFASDDNITSIVFTCSQYQTDITSDVGTCTATSEEFSWEGSAKSVTFTRPNNASSYAQFSSAKVTVGSGTTTYSLDANCCESLGSINGSVNLSQSGSDLVASGWGATTGGNENGYLVRLYNSDKSSVITSANTGSKATKTHTFTNPGAGTYWVSVSPTYSGAGNFCEIGTETFSASSITLTGNVVVTFKLNGGTVAGDEEKTQEVPVSTNTPLTSIATLGYVAPTCKQFGGWAASQEDANAETPVVAKADGASITVTEATNLWAIWNTKTISVTDGDIATSVASHSYSEVACDGTLTITCAAAEAYKGDPTVTATGTHGAITVVSPTQVTIANVQSDIAVSIAYETPKLQYAITWMVEGVAYTPHQEEEDGKINGDALVYEGNTIAVLPTAPAGLACANTFMGWSRKNYNTVPKGTGEDGYYDLFTTGAGAGEINKDEVFYAVFAKQTTSDPEEHNNVISWSRSEMNDNYTTGYTFSATAADKSGYYQDASSGTGALKLYHTSTALFTSTPTSVTLTANIGAGQSASFTNYVYAQLLDKDGNGIGNPIQVTKVVETATGDTYTPSFDLTDITSAYGVQLYHEKESSRNIRYFSFSLSYVSGGTTYSNYVTKCAAVAAPTFSVKAGTYDAAQTVELSCETEGAAIYYTTNGETTPTSASTPYEGAITVNQSMTIKAVAILNSVASDVNSAAYVLKVKTPTINADKTEFFDKATVTLACEDTDAKIYYTIGEAAEAEYAEPFEVNATATVTAVAKRTGWTDSESASQKFTKLEDLDVAGAIAAIDQVESGQNTEAKYVRGIISSNPTFDSKYNSLTYNISADGESTSDQLKVYSGKSYGGANFSSADDLLIGDEVVVYGTMKLYQNTTYQFNYDNQLVERKQRVLSIALSGDYMTECNEGATFSHEGMIVTATYNYGDDAVVTANATWSTPDLSTEGAKTVTVSYTFDGKTVTKDYTITVNHVCASEVTITKDEEANGTFALSATGAVCGDGDGATVAVTDIVPAEGYRFAGVTSIATGGTDKVGTVVITETDTTVTGIKAATTITVVFEEIPTRTINYSIGGAASSTTAKEGTSILAALPENPTPCDAINYPTFYGWKAGSAIEGLADDAPEILNSEALVTASTPDVTYYAVFTNASSTDLFTWEGGAKAGLEALDEVKANSLGSDYAASHAPYRVKFDETGDYIDITTEGAIASVSVGIKLASGAPTSTSSITVKESTNGTTFTDVETLDISGAQNDILDLSTTQSFASTSRRVRLYFTKGGVNVGVGPIHIEGVAVAAKYMTTCCTKRAITIDANIANGTVVADLELACENDEVTLSPTAVGPYHFDAWDVYVTNSDPKEVVTVTNNKFIMPAAAVTVSATFEHDPCQGLEKPALDGEIVVDYQSALIAWSEVENASSYVLNITEGETPVVENASITDLSDLSYLVENLTAKTTYNFSIMAVGDGTDYCATNTALEGNFTTIELPAAHLILSENGVEHEFEKDQHKLNDVVALPSAEDCSKTFVGWSADANCAVAPDTVEGTQYQLKNTTQTLYAVYADVTEGTTTWDEITAVPTAGIYAICSNANFMKASVNSGRLENGTTAPVIANDQLTIAPASDCIWEVSINSAGKFLFKNGANYAASTGVKNKAQLLTDATDTKSQWNVEYNNGFVVTSVANVAAEVNATLRNNGDNGWAAYAASTGSAPRFFKKNATMVASNYGTTCVALLEAPEFSLAEQEDPFTSKQTVELTADEGTIYYTLDGTTPTSESTEYNGAIVLNTCGTHTIKAIAISANNHSEVVSKTYTLNIPLPENSELIPYTPTEARAVIDGSCYDGETVMYVKGVVKSCTEFNSNFGNYDVVVRNIGDEAPDAPTFTYYHMYAASGKVKFTADEEITAGDTIVAAGVLTLYGTTYEFANNTCYMVEHKKYLAPKEHIANTQDDPYTVAQAIGFCDNAIAYYLTDEVYVQGVVKSISGTTNINIFLHDADVDNEFELYHVNLNENEIGANDTIIAKGTILKYNTTTYEMSEGGLVVEVKKYVAPVVPEFTVSPTAVAFGNVEQGAEVEAIEVSVELTAIENATVTLAGTGASAFNISTETLTEDGIITVTANSNVEVGEYAATITLHDVAEAAEDVVINVSMNVTAVDPRHKAQDIDGFDATSGNLNSEISYEGKKGTGTAAAAIPSGKNFIRIYQGGGYLAIDAAKGCTIDEVIITTAEDGSATTSIAVGTNENNLPTSGGTSVSKGETFTTGTGMNSEHVYLVCVASSNTQRLDVATIVVKYTGEAQAVDHYTLAGEYATEFPKNGTFSSEGLVVYACYANDESDNVNITAQCTVEADLSTMGDAEAIVKWNGVDIKHYAITVVAGQDDPALAYKRGEQVVTSEVIDAVNAASWTAPTLSMAFEVSPINYQTSNNTVLTVNAEGEIAWAGGYGTAKITASFAETEEYIASVATYTLTINEPANKIAGEWHKVTSIADLAIGSKVIFVGAKDDDTKYTMGEQNSNNRAAVVVYSENEQGIITAKEGTKTFILVDAGNGLYAFKANNGKYLYAAGSGSSNHMREQATINDNAKWSISIADDETTIQAHGSNTNNLMRFNSSSSLFSCYGPNNTQAGVTIYLNRKEYVAPAIDPENPTPATPVAINTNVEEEEIVASGNVVVTVNTDNFEEPKSYIAQNGATIVINGNGAEEAKSVVADEQSTIQVNQPTTVNQVFSVAATMGGGKSGQITGVSNVTIAENTEAYFDITLGDNANREHWHAIAVPFPVDAISGVYDAETGLKLTNEVNYAIMEYHGNLRAQGLYGWKKIRTTLMPGVFYLMTVDGITKTFRFKMSGTTLPTANSLALELYAQTSGNTMDGGWNGVANPTLQHGTVNQTVTVLNPNTYTYEDKDAGEMNFVVGTPFFIQANATIVSEGMEMGAVDGDKPYYAPKRASEKIIENVKVFFGNDEYKDKLTISANEEALNEYQIGKDLAKMTMTNTPKVAQIFGNAYNAKMCRIYAPMVNDQAEYSLTLYAPQAGEYTISVSEVENADIYLTHEGAIIWNLSMGAYTNDFAKGNTEGYGLIMVKKAPQVATGVDSAEANEAGVQKVIIEDKVFILRGGQMYDVTGKAVK